MASPKTNYDAYTCEELAALAQDADLGAFSELVKRHENGLYHFLYPFVAYAHPGEGEDASDLVQQTFVRAWQQLGKYNKAKPFKPWLYTIGRRAAVNRYRRLNREYATGTTHPSEASASSPDKEIMRSEARRNLWHVAEHRLQPRQFQVLWLFYSEELSMKQIAKVMNMTSVHIRVLLYRARQQLAESLTAAEETHSPEENIVREDLDYYPQQ